MLKKIRNHLNEFFYNIKTYGNPEIWRDVPNYLGCYKVSSHGRIKSLKRIVDHPIAKQYTVKEKILRPSTDNGYARVYLYGRGNRERVFVHKIVAGVFLIRLYSGVKRPAHIRHIDGNRLNNNSSNLMFTHGRRSPR